MAKINFGGIVTEARGKVGTLVYSRNRYSAYAKNKTIPFNPKTAYQITVRNRMSAAAKAWSNTLTTAQRSQWNAFAALLHKTNQLGQPINYSGYIAFQKCAITSNLNGGPVPTSPPAFPFTYEMDTFSVNFNTVAGATLILQWSPSSIANVGVQIYATGIIPIGHTWLQNRIRYLTTISSASPSSNLWAAYTARFPAPVAGEVIGIMAAFYYNQTNLVGIRRQLYLTWLA